jgi:hypothetical protein
MATAQVGVPAAVVSIGLRTGAIDADQATSIITSVLGSLALCAIGAALLGHSPRLTDHAAPAHPRPERRRSPPPSG